MEAGRPIVLSIAGFDPCGGAGLLADSKTFEQHKVYGLGICTAQTIQTENRFISVRWEREEDILQSLDTMLSYYPVKAVKTGIVEDVCVLEKVVSFIHQKNSSIKIIIDTVLTASSGFDFWKKETGRELLTRTLEKAYLITPNYNEVKQLAYSSDAKEAAQKLSAFCNVLLKGGHNSEETGVDYLFTKDSIEKIPAGITDVYPKHGSGCVLSAAITANLATGHNLPAACKNAKKYIEHFLSSNATLSGYHHV